MAKSYKNVKTFVYLYKHVNISELFLRVLISILL